MPSAESRPADRRLAARVALLALATLLALSTLLALTLTALLALAALLTLTVLALTVLGRSAGQAALLRHLLHLLAEAFQARQFLLQAAALVIARLRVGIHRRLRGFQIAAQLLERLGDGRFARHHQLALTFANVARGILHAQFGFVLLDIAQAVAHARRSRGLRPGEIARGFLHVFFELVDGLRHLVLLIGKLADLASHSVPLSFCARSPKACLRRCSKSFC